MLHFVVQLGYVVLLLFVQVSTVDGAAELAIIPKPLAALVYHFTCVPVFRLYCSLGFLVRTHPCNPGLTVP